MLWRSRPVLRIRTKDVFGRRGQNAQDQQGFYELLRWFEYEGKHRRDGDGDENRNCEAVICQQRSHTTPIRIGVTCRMALEGHAEIYGLVSWEPGKLLPTPSVR